MSIQPIHKVGDIGVPVVKPWIVPDTSQTVNFFVPRDEDTTSGIVLAVPNEDDKRRVASLNQQRRATHQAKPVKKYDLLNQLFPAPKFGQRSALNLQKRGMQAYNALHQQRHGLYRAMMPGSASPPQAAPKPQAKPQPQSVGTFVPAQMAISVGEIAAPRPGNSGLKKRMNILQAAFG